MKALTDTGILTRHDYHGEWNYSLNPPRSDTPDLHRVISPRALSRARTYVSMACRTAERTGAFRDDPARE
jgi:hypothetical protein